MLIGSGPFTLFDKEKRKEKRKEKESRKKGKILSHVYTVNPSNILLPSTYL